MAGAVWNRLSGELAVSTENEFVRRVLPLLHVLWPDLAETPHRQHWDSFGIDLVEWADEGPFPTVVQCKGWHIREIGSDQVRLVEKSVDSFLASGASCTHFAIVHNRDGRYESFNQAVMDSLKRLVAAGVAQRVSLLDRQKLIVEVKRAIDKKIESGMREGAAQRLKRFPRLFSDDSEYIERVPFDQATIQIRRTEASTIIHRKTTASGSVAKALLRATGLSWSILEGPFGSGKTTSALHAAQSRDRTVVFIPCADLPANNISLNDVLVQSARELELWNNNSDEERSLLDSLAADSAIRLLSGPRASDRYVVVLDGLDEHRAFYKLSGIQRLLNQLIDIECPVVLTTRSEHFATFFDSYTTAFSELSWKFKPELSIPLLQLRAWTREESVSLINRVRAQEQPAGAKRLRELAALTRSGKVEDLYGTLPSNPLMLRFIIDDVAARGVAPSERAPLMGRWARRKLWRDVASHSFITVGDVGETVEVLIRASELISGRMTETSNGRTQLTESLPLEIVREIVGAETSFDLADVLTNSFLMPIRSIHGTRVIFALRVLQEFFLAALYVRTGNPLDGLPVPVQNLGRELLASCMSDATASRIT